MRLVLAPALAVILAVLFSASLLATGDITPPAFVEAWPQHPQIDTADAAQTITFTFHLTDDLSGVYWLSARWVHSQGYNTNRDCTFYISEGEYLDVFVPCAVTFPRYSADGRWLLYFIIITDNVGNRRYTQVASEVMSNGEVIGYEYTPEATEAMRALEIQIGEVAEGSYLYLPHVFR
jgi:hypothetical protein